MTTTTTALAKQPQRGSVPNWVYYIFTGAIHPSLYELLILPATATAHEIEIQKHLQISHPWTL